MRTLSYACAAALGLAALAGPVLPAAHADDSDFRYGGCNFEYEYPSETQITGMVSDFSVTTTGYGNPRAIGATVTCWLEIDGKGAAPGTTFSYSDLGGVPGVQAGANPVSFTLDNPLAIVFGCESDAFADGTTLSSCQYNDNFQMPPQPIADLNDHTWKTVNGVLGVFGMLTPYTDPVVCPVLRQLPGNYPGGLTIGPNGYLHFSDPLGVVEVTYECPPAGSSRR